MRAFSIATLRRTVRPLFGSLAILLTLALLSASFGTNLRPAHAQGAAPDSPLGTFPGTGLGAIPDSPGGTPPTYGTPLVISYPVTGISGPVTDVSVSITLTHSWAGDLDMVLAAPGGSPNLVVVGHIGVTAAGSFGSSSDYNGTYVFSDSAAGANIWTAAASTPIPAGTYRTTVRGMAGTTNPPAVTSLNTTFGGLTPAQANGTWTLTIRDGGGGDTGSVTASILTVNPTGPLVVPQHVVDYDGDGKTDPTVARNTGGGASGQETFFISNSGGAPASTTTPWGLATDSLKVPADYDGDGKTDVAVWRAGPPFGSYFYILQSATGTLRTDQFGQTGDDPTVVGDYDGDGKADPAVYRAGTMAGDHSFWYYRSSVNGLIIGTEWGQNGDFPSPGDYDGDHKYDYVVQRNAGGGQAIFFFKNTTAGQSTFIFGTPTDVIAPGDYDGDGKTDISVWRPNADPSMDYFYWRRSSDGTFAQFEWGQNGDYPIANSNAH